MSDSVRPHRWQPTRLPHPWDSPGKNTGVGCHFLLQCMKAKSESEVAQSCPTLSDHMDCSPPGSSICGIFQARVLEWGAIAFSANSDYQHVKWVQLYGSLNILWHSLSLRLEWKLTFSSPVATYWVFQICWHIECSTFTASSCRIWNSSTGIPSPPFSFVRKDATSGPLDFAFQDVWV